MVGIQRINRVKERISRVLISRKKFKWIFIIGCYNSGTTLLARILEQHPKIAGLPAEGHFLTNKLITPLSVDIPRLWTKKEDLFTIAADEKEDLAKAVLKDWKKHITKVNAEFILEKSPPDIARLLWLQKNFPDACFIHIIRNGYAVALGIEKKIANEFSHKQDVLRLAAYQWKRSAEIFRRDSEKLNKVLEVSYEELSENPVKTIKQITDFLVLSPLEESILNKSFKIRELNKVIENQNPERLKQMTLDEKRIISSTASNMLIYYGYEKNQPQIGADR